MGAGDVFVHFLRVGAYKFARILRVRIGIDKAGRNGVLHTAGQCHRQVAPHGNGPQRQGQRKFGLPPLPQIKQFYKALPGIGKAPLVDNQPKIGLAAGNGSHNVAEQHFLARAQKTAVQVQQQVGRGQQTGHCHRGIAPVFGLKVFAGHHKGAAAPAKRRARRHQGIIVHYLCGCAKRHLGYIQGFLPRKIVQFFHIGHVRRKGRGNRHKVVQHGVEDIGIVGAGRKTKRQVLRRQGRHFFLTLTACGGGA